MKILQICNRVPFPAKDGGALAMHTLTESFIELEQDVQVAALNTSRNYVKPESLPEEYRRNTRIITADINTDPSLPGAFLYLFRKGSYNIDRFYSPAFDRMLSELLAAKEFDIVQMESIYVAPYLETIRKHSRAKVVLRAHNAEFRIWERRAENLRNPVEKACISFLAERLKAYETGRFNQFDAIVAISPHDAEIFRANGCKVPVHVTPFGIKLHSYKDFEDTGAEVSACFIGSMDWTPNTEGLEWFLEHCWPQLTQRLPFLKLRVAGKNMPEKMKSRKIPNVEMLGEVPSSAGFIGNNSLMIVPLLSGSGMRVKIIEAMAMGKPVISTTIGAEGIGYTNGQDLFTADTPAEFSNLIEKCTLDKQLRERIGKSARLLAQQEYDSTVLASRLLDFYKTI